MQKSYQDLLVWQKAHQLTLDIYSTTNTFPYHEKFGIISQIRRAVISVELNIVEGKSRNTDKEFRQFLFISRGSNQEVHCLLKICKDLQYLSHEQYSNLTFNCEEVNKMLNGLIKRIQ